jgi:hypothetical protein
MNPDGNLAEWDAAYIFGALTPQERLEYEQFLSNDPAQAATLAQFDDLPALLDVLSPEEAFALIDDHPAAPTTDPAPNVVSSLAVAADKRRDRSRRTRMATVLAAAAAFLIIGAVVGYTAIPREAPAGISLTAMAPGQRPGITASLAVSAQQWGTRLDWNCQYTKDWATNVASYDLVVTTKDGKEAAVASWRPKGNKASDLAAATVIPTSQIHTVEIRVTGTTTPLAVTTLS